MEAVGSSTSGSSPGVQVRRFKPPPQPPRALTQEALCLLLGRELSTPHNHRVWILASTAQNTDLEIARCTSEQAEMTWKTLVTQEKHLLCGPYWVVTRHSEGWSP